MEASLYRKVSTFLDFSQCKAFPHFWIFFLGFSHRCIPTSPVDYFIPYWPPADVFDSPGFFSRTVWNTNDDGCSDFSCHFFKCENVVIIYKCIEACYQCILSMNAKLTFFVHMHLITYRGDVKWVLIRYANSAVHGSAKNPYIWGQFHKNSQART